MSYDFSLWKWREPNVSPALCDLILCGEDLPFLILSKQLSDEEIPVPDLQPLDVELLRAEIDSSFPGRDEPDANPAFSYEITDYYIAVNATFSSANQVASWFVEFATNHKLFLYDCQQAEPHDEMFDKYSRKVEKVMAELSRRLEEEDQDSGYLKLIERAEAGDARACVKLGTNYHFGETVRQDYKAAFGYYKKAADLGEPDGFFNLAACYRRGEGVEKDLQMAIELYEEILDKDPWFAGYELGAIYQYGEGVEVNLAKARQYYSVSEQAGNTEAKKKLKELAGG